MMTLLSEIHNFMVRNDRAGHVMTREEVKRVCQMEENLWEIGRLSDKAITALGDHDLEMIRNNLNTIRLLVNGLGD